MIKTFSTRYLGSKVKLLDWIWKESESIFNELNVKSVADPFSGTNSVAYLFKQKGFEVLSNDFLLFNYYRGVAFIENNDIKLSEKDIDFLLNNIPKIKSNFIEREFTDVFFPKEDTVFLDNVYFSIPLLNSKYKEAIAYSAISQAILKRAPYGRFTTTKMTNLGKKTIKEYFEELLKEYNNVVLDNNKSNKAFCEDAIDFMSKLEVDAVYFDPPYGGKNFSKYEHYYNFVELYVNYWESEEMLGKLKQIKKKNSSFSIGKNHDQLFKKLLSNSSHINLWIFSYNNNGGLKIEELCDIVSDFKKNIIIKEIDYEYANKIKKYKEFLIFAY